MSKSYLKLAAVMDIPLQKDVKNILRRCPRLQRIIEYTNKSKRRRKYKDRLPAGVQKEKKFSHPEGISKGRPEGRLRSSLRRRGKDIEGKKYRLEEEEKRLRGWSYRRRIYENGQKDGVRRGELRRNEHRERMDYSA